MGIVTGTEDIQEEDVRLTSEPVVYVGDKRFEDSSAAEIKTTLTKLLRTVAALRVQVRDVTTERQLFRDRLSVAEIDLIDMTDQKNALRNELDAALETIKRLDTNEGRGE